tara:strand:- start:884 stop:1891 length:1008 start_codon:yes stop_codon:yes gene_type:complete
MHKRYTVTQYENLNHTDFTKEKYKAVYLMVGEDPYNALKGNIPIKIGISNKVDKRKEQIKKGLSPKEVFVDGIKQTIHITNPEIFCISLPLAYAEAVEKAAQQFLCSLYEERTGASAKISGYNDWFQTDSLLDGALSIFLGIEEIEGDISLEKAEKYNLAVSKLYNRNHEFFDTMEITANKLPLLFAHCSDPSKISLSDKQTLKKSKKLYLLRDAVEEEIPKGEDANDWLTLVIPVRNCADKRKTARFRTPLRKEDLVNVSWNLMKLKVDQILSLIAFSHFEKKYMAGLGAIDPKRNAILLGEARQGLPRKDGSFEWKNQIDLCPHEWWRLARVR